MHLYAITRGIKHEVDRFINDMQAQYYRAINPRVAKALGVDPTIPVWTQFAMRPVQLWEMVFPAEHLNEVLATVTTGERDLTTKQNALFAGFRKMLGAKKIPKIEGDLTKMPQRIVYKQNMECHLIGIKEDSVQEDGSEML